ncbi:MAG: glycosyltransferase, partial [Deltaproteobacteria bacterium]|nr:glycosyltransferase [Deltaproteobacteria bacterium]
MTVWATILFLCAALVALPCAYLLLLTLASADLGRKTPRARTLRFAFVVPAHNEERGIGDTVRSLLAVTWPREAFRVVVVADNCSDA